ncbi:LTA synthase family protein, partial [bacterium]|nr:LTA synthase family protein [bacterium]
MMFFIFLFVWSSLNFANHEFASEFNTLLPLSWFKELRNAGSVDIGADIIPILLGREFLLNVLIPVTAGVILTFVFPTKILKSSKRIHMLFIVIFASALQSATLNPEIQPRHESIIQSHMFKYWYYDWDAEILPARRKDPLPEFSSFFKEVILEQSEERDSRIPSIKGKTKPNVVIIQMESFRAYDLGIFGSDLGLSPNFDRYASKGLLFDNFYSTSGKTSRGLWSILCGAHSHAGGSVIGDYKEHGVLCLSDILFENQYETYWFHGQSGSYDSIGYFINSHSVKNVMDRLTFPNDAEVVGFGIGDLDLMKHALSQAGKANQPYFWMIQTNTNHHPHEVQEEFDKYKKYSNVMNKFYNTFAYSDYALGYFLDNYLKTPQGKNSLIIIVADHGVGKETKLENQKSNLTTFLQYRIPMLILYPE